MRNFLMFIIFCLIIVKFQLVPFFTSALAHSISLEMLILCPSPPVLPFNSNAPRPSILRNQHHQSHFPISFHPFLSTARVALLALAFFVIKNVFNVQFFTPWLLCMLYPSSSVVHSLLLGAVCRLSRVMCVCVGCVEFKIQFLLAGQWWTEWIHCFSLIPIRLLWHQMNWKMFTFQRVREGM